MNGFLFRINKSFVNYEYNHPITIPRASSPDLEKGGFLVEDVKVIFPNGREMDGYIYSAGAGGGTILSNSYLTVRERPSKLSSHRENDFLKFEKSGNRVKVNLLSVE
jgi:hypothetical protein